MSGVGFRTGRLLPQTAYLPGHGPRPAPEWLEHEDAMAWAADLFDAGHHWLAHEVWESLWIQHPRASAPARFLQGLLMAAASLVKQAAGYADAAHEVFMQAVALLEDAMYELGAVVEGIDILHFVAIVDHALHGGPAAHVPDAHRARSEAEADR